MTKAVAVVYEGNDKQYTYQASDDLFDKLGVGDIVVVPVARGWGFSIAKVAKVSFPDNYLQSLPFKAKHIIAKLANARS